MSHHHPASSTRAAVLISAAGLLVSGCAGAPGWDYVARPGVPADITLARGESVSGTLVEFSDGSLVVDTSVERSEDVEVIRKGGVDYVYVDGVVIGTAVEIRGFDILTRQRIPLRAADEISVKTRAYFGWGSAIAGVLAFFLVKVLEDATY